MPVEPSKMCKCGHYPADHVNMFLDPKDQQSESHCRIANCSCQQYELNNIPTPNIRMCSCGHSENYHDPDVNYMLAGCRVVNCSCSKFSLSGTNPEQGLYKSDPRRCKRCKSEHGIDPLSIATQCGAVQEVSFNPDGSVNHIGFGDLSVFVVESLENMAHKFDQLDSVVSMLVKERNEAQTDLIDHNDPKCVCGHSKSRHFAGEDQCTVKNAFYDHQCQCKHFDVAR
jgi:hypothetical protein